jgi:hypothetical protein
VAPLAQRISIRNVIGNGFSPVFTRLVAVARIAPLFLDTQCILLALRLPVTSRCAKITPSRMGVEDCRLLRRNKLRLYATTIVIL